MSLDSSTSLEVIVSILAIVASFVVGLGVLKIHDMDKKRESIKENAHSLLADIEDLLQGYDKIPDNPVEYKVDKTYDWKVIHFSLDITDYVVQSGEIKKFDKETQLKILNLKGKKDIYIFMLHHLFDLLYLTHWQEKEGSRKSIDGYTEALKERKTELKEALQNAKTALERYT